ncbi:zinc finger protein 10-like [Amborella trichopoda]|uniref:C2H2-type domain-containing protein n=1 Tax=Amborella trichopoda TaxID=13333 RepID=W1PK34_AMBTC|nr:zinc finger protein 10-like [Amborella trichopoda]ERN08021.1 hypothetical protein AMTR_s00012p00258820 [Amborella trichopoda]|eukprot:XP_020524107.1 zinc finger protein 10-like [Amborella trichopoda]
MEQTRYWMWTRRKFMASSGNRAANYDSWEEQAFAEDSAGPLGGFIWPPRSYSCTFCKREFRSAQALGGHMNVHRRDRARLRQSPSPHSETQSLLNQYPSEPCTLTYPNPNFSPSLSSTEVSGPSNSCCKANCSHMNLGSPPAGLSISSFSSSAVVMPQQKHKASFASSPPLISESLDVEVLSLTGSKHKLELSGLPKIDAHKIKEHRNFDGLEKLDPEASLPNMFKKRRVWEDDEDRESGESLTRKRSKKCEFFPYVAGLFTKTASAVEELDLELRLGSKPSRLKRS